MPRASLLFALLLMGAPADAGQPAALQPGGTATVARVIDGDTLALADGREVRLLGIAAPKRPPDRPSAAAWPPAEAAREGLAGLVLGHTVSLTLGERRMDRHGRVLAQLHDEGGTWIQGELLARGLVRVLSFADNRALVPDMLALERQARAGRLGIWANPYYRVRTPAEAAREVDTFQLVEGRIVQAAIVRGRGYLNFGPDWKTDFTISIEPAALRLFAAAGIALEALEGHRVIVRGWIESFNGPLIEATHPEQVEVLAP